MNTGLYILTKIYYTFRNRHRRRIWDSMTTYERREYLASTSDEGNKRLDFRFAC
jgi:hypothetical protein